MVIEKVKEIFDLPTSSWITAGFGLVVLFLALVAGLFEAILLWAAFRKLEREKRRMMCLKLIGTVFLATTVIIICFLGLGVGPFLKQTPAVIGIFVAPVIFTSMFAAFHINSLAHRLERRPLKEVPELSNTPGTIDPDYYGIAK